MIQSEEDARKPIPIEIKDMANFARLVLSLSENEQHIIWKLRYRSRYFLAFLTNLFWQGDITILTYLKMTEDVDEPFLAYRSDLTKGEEYKLMWDMDDRKYRYAVIVALDECPSILKNSLREIYDRSPPFIISPVKDAVTLMRALLITTIREEATYPLWRCNQNNKDIIGTVIPFENYSKVEPLPLFIYFINKYPSCNFIKYDASKKTKETIQFVNNTREINYFYAKIISVEEFTPLNNIKIR